MGVPCAATGTTLTPPTRTIIAMEQTIHITAETEVTASPTRTTAADTTSMKRTMDTTDTITAMMVTENITAEANTPAPTLKTIMMAAADTQTSMDVMTMTMGEAITGQSIADTTMGTSEQQPTEMRRTTPPRRTMRGVA